MIRPACWQQTNVLTVLTSKNRRTSSAATVSSGVGDQMAALFTSSVEPAEVAAGAVDHRPRGVFVAEIGAEGGRFVPACAQFVDQCLGLDRATGWHEWRRGSRRAASSRTIAAPTRTAPPVTRATG